MAFLLIITLSIVTTSVSAQSSQYTCIEMSDGECSYSTDNHVKVDVVEKYVGEENGTNQAFAIVKIDTSNSEASEVRLSLDGKERVISSEEQGLTEHTIVKEYGSNMQPREVMLEIEAGTNRRTTLVGNLRGLVSEVTDLPPGSEETEDGDTSEGTNGGAPQLDIIPGQSRGIGPDTPSNLSDIVDENSTNIIVDDEIKFNYSSKTPPSRFLDEGPENEILETRNIPPFSAETKGQVHEFYNLRYPESSSGATITSSSDNTVRSGIAFYNLREVSDRGFTMTYSMSGLSNLEDLTVGEATGKIKIVDAFGNVIEDEDGNDMVWSLEQTHTETPLPALSNSPIELNGDNRKIQVDFDEKVMDKINREGQFHVVVEAEDAGSIVIHDLYTQGST